MTPVIRISDKLYAQLESLAIGFDTPSNVIERLAEYYMNENEDKRGARTVEASQQSTKRIYPVLNHRKKRDIELEKKLKQAVGRMLFFDAFSLNGTTIINKESKEKVLCKFSSYSDINRGWFWGISEKYWSNWDHTWSLALILEQEERNGFSCIILNSNEAKELFPKCSESNGEKKINLRRSITEYKPHFQEWKNFEIGSHIKEIPF